MALTNRADDIPFHDLHVVNVLQQLEALGTDPLAQLNTPTRVVAHVVFVIDLAVEQFHHQIDLVLFTDSDDSLEADLAVLHPLGVVHAFAVARHANNARHAGRRRAGNQLFELRDESIMVLFPIESLLDSQSGTGHSTGQPVLLDGRPVIFLEQLDRLDADALAGLTKFVKCQLAVTPARDGVVNITFEWFSGLGQGGPHIQSNRHRGSPSSHSPQNITACHLVGHGFVGHGSVVPSNGYQGSGSRSGGQGVAHAAPESES